MRKSTVTAVFLSAMASLSFSRTASSQTKGSASWNGVFAGIEVSAGVVTAGAERTGQGRDEMRGKSGAVFGMPDYGLGMFCGYRFRPQFAVAAGIGGNNSVVTGTTSMPIFLRLRSDILDRRVSPMVQIDAGYAFQFAYSKRTVSELSYNSDVFTERYASLGFKNAEEYVNAGIEEFIAGLGDMSDIDAARLIEDERSRIMNSLRCFGNGQRSYLPSDALDELGNFSRDGFFGSLTVGISIGIGKEHSRICAGVSVDIAQYSYSIPLRTPDNRFINISVPATLPDGTPVIVARTSLKDNPLCLALRFRLGWEF